MRRGRYVRIRSAFVERNATALHSFSSLLLQARLTSLCGPPSPHARPRSDTCMFCAARVMPHAFQLIADMDTLLGTSEHFLFGKWIARARSWAATADEESAYDFNAVRVGPSVRLVQLVQEYQTQPRLPSPAWRPPTDGRSRATRVRPRWYFALLTGDANCKQQQTGSHT